MKTAKACRGEAAGVMALLVIVLALSGCAKTQPVLTREPSALSQPSLEGLWNLKSYGPEGGETPVLPDVPVSLALSPDGKVSGSGGCNRYFGGWGFLEGDPGVIRIWRTGSTKMVCDIPVMTQEHRFLEELVRVSAYAVDGKELRLYYDGGKGVLRFSRGTNP
ncbi:MAG: META domain-containing protein [Syntrophaceae bacterium]|nr:META domain-containing protein [Syntrophaceae bacterium]